MSEPSHETAIEASRVGDWFAHNVPEASEPLSFERVSGGRSNLTYVVSDPTGGRWILRRPPLGGTQGSAHDVARECRVIDALDATEVPVPEVCGLCEDEGVTGAPFYVMEHIEGQVLRELGDAGRVAIADRGPLAERLVETLVTLHAVEPEAIGLGGLGKGRDHVARTLHRWSGQWDRTKTRELATIDGLHDRLAALVPAESPSVLVHGDYRLDNVIVSPDGEIGAVVDWELCTLGEPLSDLGMLFVFWGGEGDPLASLLEPATAAEGFPGREAIKEIYAERSGRSVEQLDFFVALGYWKLAVILEGVLARERDGRYGEEGGADLGALSRTVENLAEAGMDACRTLG